MELHSKSLWTNSVTNQDDWLTQVIRSCLAFFDGICSAFVPSSSSKEVPKCSIRNDATIDSNMVSGWKSKVWKRTTLSRFWWSMVSSDIGRLWNGSGLRDVGGTNCKYAWPATTSRGKLFVLVRVSDSGNRAGHWNSYLHNHSLSAGREKSFSSNKDFFRHSASSIP